MSSTDPVEALGHARLLAQEIALRARVAARTMRWQSAAAADFRRALEEWLRMLDGLDADLEAWQRELRARALLQGER